MQNIHFTFLLLFASRIGVPQTFPFHEDSPFTEAINEEILRLGKAGIIKRIIKSYETVKDIECHEEKVIITH